MSLKDFKTIGSNLTTTEFNGRVSLYKHFKKHYESFRITDTVNGDYADYVFDIADTTVLDNGIVITDETITAEPKVKLTNPVFHYSTYILKLDVLHYSGVNIFDDETPTDFKVVDTLEIPLEPDTWVDIPVTGLEQGYIISFDSNIEITHDLTEIHGITGLVVNSSDNPIQKNQTTELYGQLLDYNGEPYNLSDTSGHTVYFFEKLNLLYNFSATKNPLVSGEDTDVSVKLKDEDGSILVGEKVYFYEKYTPGIQVNGSPEVIQIDDDTDVTAYVKDTVDGSRIAEEGKTLYFFEEAQHLVRSVDLTVSESSGIYGDSIVLTALVSDEDSNPVSHRTVQFYDGGNSLGKGITGSDGKAVLTVSSFEVGSHSITAYTDSVTSSAVSITIAKATPSLSLSGSNINYGSNEVLTGNLSVGGGENVEIYQGSTLVDTVVTDGNGNFTKSVSGLVVGSYSFKAVYTGNDNYNGANSSVINVSVSKSTPTVSLATSASKINYGQPITLTGKVSAGTGLSVKIYNGNTVIDTVTTGANGSFSKTVTGLDAGTYTFKAVFEGNSNYNSANSANVGVTVNKTTPSLSLTGSNIVYGNNLVLTGTISNGANQTVKIYRGDSLLATVTSGTGGAFTKTLTGLNTGTYVFKAVYEGNSNYNNATSSNLTLVVNKASSSINLNVSSTAITYGESVTVSGTLSAGTGKTVKIYDGNTVIDTVTTGANGSFSKSVTGLNAGSHTLKAVFDTDANYVTSQSSTTTVTVGKQATTLSLTGQNVTYPNNVELTGSLSVPNKSVKIYNGSSLIATVTSGSDGSFSRTVSGLNAGSYTFKAVYEGDSNYIGSNSSNLNITVSKATPTISLTGENVNYPNNIVLSGVLTVSNQSVKIYNGNTLVDTITTGSDGKFTKTISGYGVGSYTFKAVFEGNTNYNSKTSSNLSITVSKGTPTLTLTGGNVSYPNDIVLTGKLSIPNKQIKIYIGNTLLETVTTDNNGDYTCSIDANTGTYTFKAVFDGDTGYNSVTKTVEVTVNKGTPTLTLRPTGDISHGQPLNLTGTFTRGTSSWSYGYSIKIYQDCNYLSSVTTGDNGVFSKTITGLSSGQHKFRAVYEGDDDYNLVATPEITIIIL